MKNILILSLLIFGVTACETMNRAPYAGGRGEYGFTYDLEAAPSPFTDTRYFPLTAEDLAAPVIVTVTNPAPPRIIYENGPEIGVTRPSGTALYVPPTTTPPYIIDAAGADRGTAAGTAPVVAGGGYGPGGAYYGAGVTIVGPGSDGSTNTNTLAGATLANVTTNINGTNFVLTTNGFIISEPAGSQRTNPLTRLRALQTTESQSQSNGAFITSSVAPPQGRILLNQRTNQAIIPNQNTTTPQTPAPNQNQNQNTTTTPNTSPNTGSSGTRVAPQSRSGTLVQPR